MRKLALVSVLALLPPACLGSDFAASVEGGWQLVSGTVNGDEIPILDTHRITLTLDGENVGGTASCNSYGGRYDLSGSTLTVGEISVTEMACEPTRVMDAEQLYLTGLIVVNQVVIDESGLTLIGPDTVLVFEDLEPVPDAELTNTVWVLDGLVTGDAVSSVAAERATLEFFTDGSVLGGTGCRTFAGRYTTNGSEAVVTDIAGDGHECEPDLVGQDNHVLSVLDGNLQVEIEENRLTITTADGNGLTYTNER